ncbi:MAG: kelch repeat-containing protein, partial [Nitrososphaeraceae archaeon]
MTDNVSRRDFLKLLGVGAMVLGLGGMGGMSQLVYDRKANRPALAQQGTGSWANGQNCTVNPIHVALLPSGRIFYLAGSGYSTAQQFGPYTARVLDINTGSETAHTQTDDLFCIGLTHLANGTVLMAGGTLQYNGNPDNCNGRWHGLNAAYELSPSSETPTKVTNMRHGRWYPTLVTLPDGKVWCCSGYDEYGVINRIVEVYDPSSKTWALVEDPNSNYTYTVGAGYETTCPGPHPSYSRTCPPVSFYPRTHLMPNGLLVLCGMRRESWTWNPANGDFVAIGNNSVYRDYGTSFLCPLQNTTAEKGKILLVGGSETTSGLATTACQMLDFNASSTSTPVRRSVSPTAYRRKFFAPVVLPDGKMLVLGGSEQGN